MTEAQVTRGAFIRLMGAASTTLVGLSIAASPRHALALVSGASILRKVTTLKKLKVGVNGPFTFNVTTSDPLNTNQIFLVRSAKGTVTALEATCRHMGCAVNWVAADKLFECPCHGSEYASSGKVVQGPATQNLFVHKVVIKAGQVWVMTGRATK
jgi:Rieske Fe-S protein